MQNRIAKVWLALRGALRRIFNIVVHPRIHHGNVVPEHENHGSYGAE